jgi:YHS domain-containing protein
MRNRLAKRFLVLSCILTFTFAAAFARAQLGHKPDSMKKHDHAACKMDSMKMRVACMADSMKKAGCKMKGDSAKCACQKAGKACDGSCKKEGKSCCGDKLKAGCMADSMKKADCKMKGDSAKCACQKAGKACDGSCKKEGKALIMQKTCPVTGEPVDQKVYLDYQGKRIYFCCAACKEKFQKSPESYLKKIK